MSADAPKTSGAGVAAGPVVPRNPHHQNTPLVALVQAAVLAVGERRGACLLCGRPDAEGVAALAFTDPDLRRRVGAPPKKLRVHFFPVCSECAALQERETAAPRCFHVAALREQGAQR